MFVDNSVHRAVCCGIGISGSEDDGAYDSIDTRERDPGEKEAPNDVDKGCV